MDPKKNRNFLIIAIAAISFFMLQLYNDEVSPKKTTAVESKSTQSGSDFDIPEVATRSVDAVQASTLVQDDLRRDSLTVDTPLYNVVINKRGGDIISLDLKEYSVSLDEPDVFYSLLGDNPEEHFQLAQSGLLSDMGPDSKDLGRSLFTSQSESYSFEDGAESLTVPLTLTLKNGVKVTKSFTFYLKDHFIEVTYTVNNSSHYVYRASLYNQFKHRYVKKSSQGFGVNTFSGPALSTPKKPFKKLNTKDINKTNFSESIENGWVAVVDHYFLASWVPPVQEYYDYYTKSLTKDTYVIGYRGPLLEVMPGDTASVSTKLYAGPEIRSELISEKLGAPKTLALTVDYGWLGPLCEPLFWILKKIESYVGNWGLAIILTTILIKLGFYQLSAASYRSMGKMKKIQPRIQELNKLYADDKQKLGVKMMELYKKEKINPFGGCLPILIQIPFFLALYYMLLESVELRHAPFMLWIQDLSAQDPYYILPLFLGVTMFLQQSLNPPPPDPMQAKVMKFMPLMFTFFCLHIPSGLVLYWCVNNLLSILQQWVITKKAEAEAS